MALVLRNAGLVKFDGSSWIQYKTNNSDILSNKVTSVTEDPDHNIWIGTTDLGIAKFDGTTWSKYATTNYPLLLIMFIR